MVDIGMNEGLEVRQSSDGPYFVLWPFGSGPQQGNYYRVALEPAGDIVRASVPAMPGFVGEGIDSQRAEHDLGAKIRAYLYRLKDFLDSGMPLLSHSIGPDPDHPGEDAVCVQPDGIPVWAIIGSMKAAPVPDGRSGYYDRFLDDTAIRRTAKEYGVSVEAVQAAVAYYYWHTPVIDARIEANNVAA